jgi:hexokinase
MRRRSNTNAAPIDAGSLAQVPSDLDAQVRQLEQLFTVSTEKLKEITEYFVSELERGLASDEGDHIVRMVGLTGVSS